MTVNNRTARTGAKRTNRKAGAEDKGEIVSLNVYLSQDPRKGATKDEFLGEIPDSETYREQAARTFGGNKNYLFVPRYGDGTFGASFAQFCPEINEATSENGLGENAPVGDNTDKNSLELQLELARLKERERLRAELGLPSSFAQPSMNQANWVAMLKDLDELRSKGQSQPTNNPSDIVSLLRQAEEVRRLVTPKEPPQRPVEPERKTSALASLLNVISEDPQAVATLRRGVLSQIMPRDGEEPSAAESWITILPTVAPYAQAIIHDLSTAITAFFTSRTQAPMPQAEAPGAPAAQPQAQPRTEMPPPPDNGQQQNQAAIAVILKRLIGRIVTAMAANEDDVIPSVNSLIEFCELFPEYTPVIESWMKAEPSDLFMMLAQQDANAAQVTTLPHAAAWMKKLQATFFADDDGETTDGQATPPAQAKAGGAS